MKPPSFPPQCCSVLHPLHEGPLGMEMFHFLPHQGLHDEGRRVEWHHREAGQAKKGAEGTLLEGGVSLVKSFLINWVTILDYKKFDSIFLLQNCWCYRKCLQRVTLIF